MRVPAPASDSLEGLREAARTVFLRALERCGVEQAFDRKVSAGAEQDWIELEGEDAIDLRRVKKVCIVAVGKGAWPMLRAMLPRIPVRCAVEGVLIAPECPAEMPREFVCFAGGHPLPNEASFAGAKAALALLRRYAEDQDCFGLNLIGGGASAMMELPLDPTLSLAETIAFHRALVHSGASIAEINCVRKHFSAVKGGRLALAGGALKGNALPSLSLLLSDVPLGHLDALGSGPTLPDSSTIAQCRAIIARYGLAEAWPEAVRRFFASPELQETPKAVPAKARAYVVLAPEDLAAAAVTEAEALGFHAVLDNTCDDWDYRDAAMYLLERLRVLRARHPRVCLLSSGELTVKVPQRADGVGGRNQHFALYAARLLTDPAERAVVFSAGSDGVDGNSAAAGAMVDATTLIDQGGRDRRQEALAALERFNSSGFLGSLGATVVTGPTGNNLRDLRVLLAV